MKNHSDYQLVGEVVRILIEELHFVQKDTCWLKHACPALDAWNKIILCLA